MERLRDPRALQRVLDSGVPVTFVPLDTQVPVDSYVVRDVERAARTPPADVVASLLTSSPFFVSGEFFFWDPLAAAAAAQPSLFTMRSSQVSVVTGGAGAGWTTVGGGSTAQIAGVVDGDDFIGSYLATLDGRTAPLAVSRVPDAVISGGSGCTVAPSAINSGASVLLLDSPSSAAALGTIEPGRTDAEIEAFLATLPQRAATLVRGFGAPADRRRPRRSSLVALAPGELTVVCLRVGADGATVSGRASLEVDIG